MKKIVYIDMDNVLVDFSSGIDRLSDEIKKEYENRLDDVPDIFSLMDPMPDAVESVKNLQRILICMFYQLLRGKILQRGPIKQGGYRSILVRMRMEFFIRD